MSSMFSQKGKNQAQQEIPTLISKGCTIDGNLVAAAVVRIDGSIKGDMTIEDGLIIGEDGSVEGNIRTKEVVVHGKVSGNITASHVEIRSSGKVKGEIITRKLVIENGAIYNGNLSMDIPATAEG